MNPQINGRLINGRIEPWDASCGCDRCKKRIPSPGFYRASPAEYEEAAATDRALNEWMRRQYGNTTNTTARAAE